MQKKGKQADTQPQKPDRKVTFRKIIRVVLISAVVLFVLAQFFPERVVRSLEVSGNYGLEMVMIFPAVLVLMGLADVWVPKEKIEHYLGDNSGIKGILLATFMGTLPTGPLYVAFPIAGELLRKRASVMNVVVFLGAWASLKMPQIGVEIQFLGIQFALMRAVLTFIAIIAIATITNYLVMKEKLYE